MILPIAITATGVGTGALIADEDWIIQGEGGFLIAEAIGVALIMMELIELCLRRDRDLSRWVG